ncbi:ABC transporter permease [Beggiatoa leptomitoformis]|uniref:Transport permease protein n=1 Tax=Beggiatoa leptomitoformis TaxID=288004 RepID=A0A2N9YGZ3_9GAMM|nr:ABC transporter permease [Beggiatoa leptomitoformis]ALG68054.1 ABC transporter permease [Beggiatoa leptomitoformis]AUI69655.1 ABC transporter permease [Beggiatoa leptomitoformis]
MISALIRLWFSFLQGRWRAIWSRHTRVWLKLFLPSLLANFGEPLFYLVALGYGLGHFVGKIGDLPYVVFLASGMVCSSGMQTATFEGLYSAYTRMAVQRTWEGMLATPLDIEDIILGEAAWAATKGLLGVSSILLVATLLGMVSSWQALWILPLMILVGACFGAMALIVTTLAKSYDFFLYYVTLLLTPMTLLSGIFFPFNSLPPIIQTGAYYFPLVHAVELVRPLMTGQAVTHIILHLFVIVFYCICALWIASYLLRKRLYS